jgi:sortase system peptidoglycan-associated protein
MKKSTFNLNKTALTSALVLALCVPTFSAQAASHKPKEIQTEEVIGLSSGAVIGAIFGGPIGAFIGAFTGTLIGKIEVDKEQIDSKNKQIVAMEFKTQNYQELVAQTENLESRLEEVEFEKVQLQKQRINNLMAMTVQFRTGSAKIESHFAKQLSELAQVMKTNPDIQIDLNGFADQRGEEAFNLKLSKARVAQVQQYLIKQGVDHKRLSSHAFGESQAVAKQTDYEGDFFDRRVTVKAKKVQSKTHTASNQY